MRLLHPTNLTFFFKNLQLGPKAQNKENKLEKAQNKKQIRHKPINKGRKSVYLLYEALSLNC